MEVDPSYGIGCQKSLRNILKSNDQILKPNQAMKITLQLFFHNSALGK